jgi:hypothetical protein
MMPLARLFGAKSLVEFANEIRWFHVSAALARGVCPIALDQKMRVFEHAWPWLSGQAIESLRTMGTA